RGGHALEEGVDYGSAAGVCSFGDAGTFARCVGGSGFTRTPDTSGWSDGRPVKSWRVDHDVRTQVQSRPRPRSRSASWRCGTLIRPGVRARSRAVSTATEWPVLRP